MSERFPIPERALTALREKHGWQPGDPPIEPVDEQPEIPVARPSADDIPEPDHFQGNLGANIAGGYEPALGETTPRARTTDPRTSHAAAASVTELRASQQAVLDLFKACGPMTDEELVMRYVEAAAGKVEVLHSKLPLPMQSPSGLRTRRDELVTLGLMRDTGERELLLTGRKGIVWAATPASSPS